MLETLDAKSRAAVGREGPEMFSRSSLSSNHGLLGVAAAAAIFRFILSWRMSSSTCLRMAKSTQVGKRENQSHSVHPTRFATECTFFLDDLEVLDVVHLQEATGESVVT